MNAATAEQCLNALYLFDIVTFHRRISSCFFWPGLLLLACEWISLSITKTLQRIKYMDQNKIYRCRKYRNIYIVILYMCECVVGMVGIACTWDCLSNYIYLSGTVSMSHNIRFTTTCKHSSLFLPIPFSDLDCTSNKKNWHRIYSYSVLSEFNLNWLHTFYRIIWVCVACILLLGRYLSHCHIWVDFNELLESAALRNWFEVIRLHTNFVFVCLQLSIKTDKYNVDPNSETKRNFRFDIGQR